MSVLADWQIQDLCNGSLGMIYPFASKSVNTDENGRKILSYGLSSFGYDVRLDKGFKLFNHSSVTDGVIDPLSFNETFCRDVPGDVCIIPPNGYALGVTIEKFKMPDNVIALCFGKSTLARCGISVNVTPIEPGFIGHVVIELANQTNLPVKIEAGMGVAQFIFLDGEGCILPYGARSGKYQNQSGITLARV